MTDVEKQPVADARTAVEPFNYGWVVAFAGFFMHLCLGTMYCWGTFTPYITSYLRLYNPELTYNDTILVFLLTPAFQAMSMPIGGIIERHIGPRYTSLLGSWIMAVGVFISAYATDVITLVFTYGFCYGLGMGIAYMCPIACGMRWMPNRKGLISGIVVTGFGMGGALFNIIGANVCNPDNKASSPYFNEDVANNVPKMFQTLGVIYACCTTIGALLLRDPTDEEKEALSKAAAAAKPEEQAILPKKDVEPVGPAGMLTSVKGWLLWAMMMCSTSSGVLVVSTYKTFGATHGLSDQMLTLVGSLSLGFNGLGRLCYGALCDAAGFKTTLLIVFCTQAVLGMLFTGSAVSSLLYTTVVCLMIMNYGANFAVFPTVTAEMFGTLHVASNYGLVFSGFAAAGIILKIALGSSYLSFSAIVIGTAVASGLAAIGVMTVSSSAAKKND